MKTLGFWVDLSAVKFDEGNVIRIQAMKPGKFGHPVYGDIELSSDRFSRFAANFAGKVRGIDLDIDYDHKTDISKGNRAAGWIRSVQYDENGMYVDVELTPEARKAVADKEYRYFSPEFVDEWEDPETKTKHKDVLMGGALTNRPFLKGMMPINMSEVFSATKLDDSNNPETIKEIVTMDELLKALRAKFNLSEDADEAAIVAALNEASINPDTTLAGELRTKLELGEDADSAAIVSAIDAKLAAGTAGTGTGTAKLHEDAELIKLAETNPAIAKMLSEQKAMDERITRQETATKLAETDLKLKDDSLKAVPPVALKKLRSVMLSERPSADEVLEIIKKIAEVGLVQFGEIGSGGVTSQLTETGNAGDVLDAAVQKVLSEATDGMSYGEALDKVMVQQPDVYKRYVDATVGVPGNVG